MSGWTPGPWKWVIHDYSMASIEGPNGEYDHVLSVSPCKGCQARTKEWLWGRCLTPSEANAHLIAAAPDLYAALEKARETLCRALLVANNSRGWSPESHVRVQAIDAALRKARGE